MDCTSSETDLIVFLNKNDKKINTSAPANLQSTNFNLQTSLMMSNIPIQFSKSYSKECESGHMEKLQSKAKELGANAVIKIEFGNQFSRLYRPYCRGVAISFK